MKEIDFIKMKYLPPSSPLPYTGPIWVAVFGSLVLAARGGDYCLTFESFLTEGIFVFVVSGECIATFAYSVICKGFSIISISYDATVANSVVCEGFSIMSI